MNDRRSIVSRRLVCLAAAVCLLPGVQAAEDADPGMTFERLAAVRSVTSLSVAPDGSRVAYTRSVPRTPGEGDDGRAWTELHVVSADGATRRAFVHGEVNVSNARFTPDGSHVTYLAKRGDDEHTTLWAVPVDGGESRRLIDHDSSVLDYDVSPGMGRIAFVAREGESKARKKAKKQGYKQEVYEEDWRHRRLWITEASFSESAPTDPAAEDAGTDDEDDDGSDARALSIDGSAFGVRWFPDGSKLLATVAPRPLIDDQYMLRRVRVIDADDGSVVARIDNPGKLGEVAISPDGGHVAMISAADPNDPREGRLVVAPSTGGTPRELMPGAPFLVSDLVWLDARTLAFTADRGAESELARIGLGDAEPTVLQRSGPGAGPLLRAIDASAGGRLFGRAERPTHPSELFALDGATARRLTTSNPWLDDVALAPQEVVRWTARDGLELEGVLIRPLRPALGSPAPLLLLVHGGPEAHDRNGWVTNYSRPGQLAAARGYAVLYPNYRGSTGRGVAFSKTSQSDAAGKEFDDLVDAVDALVERGIADGDRVGIAGGSYGGYATAWSSTKHTERFRAGVMFVGISNKMSKGLTTEIPIEDEMVHTRFDPWTRWQFSLERSPIYWAEQSRTALLIAGGTADTRVHPSQSLQLYRALKLIDETPVRYVRYPGEGHGNTKAAARDDYSRRLIRWMDWYVAEGRDGLPPIELERPGDDDAEDDDED